MEESVSSEVEMGNKIGTWRLSGQQPGHAIISVHSDFYTQAPSILLMGQQAVKKFCPRSTSWSVGGWKGFEPRLIQTGAGIPSDTAGSHSSVSASCFPGDTLSNSLQAIRSQDLVVPVALRDMRRCNVHSARVEILDLIS